jgi:hypothetical protein
MFDMPKHSGSKQGEFGGHSCYGKYIEVYKRGLLSPSSCVKLSLEDQRSFEVLTMIGTGR